MDTTELLLEPGPEGVRLCLGEHAGECPLLANQQRPRSDGLHGVVVELDLDRAAHRKYLRYLRSIGAGARITLVPKVGHSFRERWSAEQGEPRRFES